MKSWPAKLLLFGEYTIFLKGEALAMPIPGLSGHWAHQKSPDQRLINWGDWLLEREKFGRLPWPIQVAAFVHDIREGRVFHSSIPVGTGVGSSGALVAAFAETYSNQLPTDLNECQRGFALLESYFHGNSSGLDPLVSLFRHTIHTDPQNGARLFELKNLPSGLFLVDTDMPRNTAPLVQLFQQMLEKESERTILLLELLPQVHRVIHALREGERMPFQDAFLAISRIQGRIFREMIPEALFPYWTGAQYTLKICGAGGGGFFLGLAQDGYMPNLPFPVRTLDSMLE